MIRVTVYQRADKSFRGMRVAGHAGDAPYGQDIVCAGVSALMTNLVNSIEKLTQEHIQAEQDEARGLMQFRFLKIPGRDAELLMRSCILGMMAIEREHGKFIRLTFKEV